MSPCLTDAPHSRTAEVHYAKSTFAIALPRRGTLAGGGAHGSPPLAAFGSRGLGMEDDDRRLQLHATEKNRCASARPPHAYKTKLKVS